VPLPIPPKEVPDRDTGRCLILRGDEHNNSSSPVELSRWSSTLSCGLKPGVSEQEKPKGGGQSQCAKLLLLQFGCVEHAPNCMLWRLDEHGRTLDFRYPSPCVAVRSEPFTVTQLPDACSLSVCFKEDAKEYTCKCLPLSSLFPLRHERVIEASSRSPLCLALDVYAENQVIDSIFGSAIDSHSSLFAACTGRMPWGLEGVEIRDVTVHIVPC